jgi:hypothetical protein
MGMDDERVERVRTLQAAGCTAKQGARTVGVPSARVTALVRAIAAEQSAVAAAVDGPRRLVGCWVSPQWSGGLTVTGHPQWPDVDFDRSKLHGGLASVLVAREDRRRHRVEVCGYLVDTHCLGLKNTVGPKTVAAGALDTFVADYVAAHDGPPLPVGLDLVQHLVFGAIEYARGLGFEPQVDLDLVVDHLGEWTPPCAITFGFHGQPLYCQGPRDNAAAIMATLNRTVG